MRYAILLNSAAGHGRAGRQRKQIERAFQKAGLDGEVTVPRGEKETAEMACRAARAGQGVIAVGGDGTVQHAARGVIESGAAVPLGVVPLGTGNDFARQLGMPRGLRTSVAALKAARPVRVDYGVVRWQADGRPAERPFVNAVGVGFDAQVAREVAAFKAVPGLAAYLAAVLRTLRRWRAPDVTVWASDGAQPDVQANGGGRPARRPSRLYGGPLLLVTVGNGATSGGGFRLTPGARLDDGLLDVCLIRAVPARRVLRLLLPALRGRHGHAPEVQMLRTSDLRIESAQGIPVHADGEVLTGAARWVEVEVVPGGLLALRPETSERETDVEATRPKEPSLP